MDLYYAARSRAKLQGVCEAMCAAFDLPPFAFDCHDNWSYGRSEGRSIRLNITRTSDTHTVETWMPGCPSGVNYQIILSAKSEPTGFVSRLAEVLGTEVIKYATSGQEADA